MTLKVEHDPEADAAYVHLGTARRDAFAFTRRLDDCRLVDVASDGTPLGVDFMVVSRGVDLRGLPEPEALAAALSARGIPIRYGPAAPVSQAT
jgi:uncharacterized protein YuzE